MAEVNVIPTTSTKATNPAATIPNKP